MQPTAGRRPVRTSSVALAAVVAALPVVAVENPNSTHVPLCPLHALTGLDCPVCGSTRAVYALLHGDLATALHDNALFVVALPLIALQWWRWDRQLRSGVPTPRLLPRAVFWGVVAVAVLFGIVRNLPVAAALAPP